MRLHPHLFAALLLGGHLALPAFAGAQPAPSPGDAAARAAATADLARTAVDTAVVNAPAATLVFENRTIVEFRATLLLRPPAVRAAVAERALHDLVNSARLERVVTRSLSGGVVISLGAADVLAIVPADLDPLGADTVEEAGQRAAASLQLALDEALELRSPRQLAVGVAWALLATAVLMLLFRLLIRFQRWVVRRSSSAADRQLQRLPGGDVVRATRLPGVLRYVVRLTTVAAGLLLVYSWLSFVLRSFPYTRPWGEALRGFLLGRLSEIAHAIFGAVPQMFTVALIVVVTRFLVKLDGLLFDAVEQERAVIPGLHPDTAPTTRRLMAVLLWLFAFALAFPYLPGSDTEAFKGVSVFVGLMLSLGSSGIVNQGMSGLTITYSRALKKGDFVKIGDAEGTVMQLGMLSTKLRTNRREVLTIPNTVVISTVTTNYTQLHQEQGVLISTSVTIGYDVPWRQVQALLLLAAEQTSGLRADPVPVVRQSGLRDFYIEYTLLVSLDDPASKPRVLDALHANIVDAFNEYGVQIMSPNYEADPDGPKIVPRDQWFAAPAAPPDRGGTTGAVAASAKTT